jgi:hypothetical protein
MMVANKPHTQPACLSVTEEKRKRNRQEIRDERAEVTQTCLKGQNVQSSTKIEIAEKTA